MSDIPTGEDVQYLMDYFENVYVDNDKVVSITLGLIEHYDVSEVTDENRMLEIKQLRAQLKKAEEKIKSLKEVIKAEAGWQMERHGLVSQRLTKSLNNKVNNDD